jgi:hypothetical protein
MVAPTIGQTVPDQLASVVPPQLRRCRLRNSRDFLMVLLHGFIKKTQQTPDKELKLARDRKRKVDNG